VFNRKLRRGEVLHFFEKLPPCLVGMEACGTAHYWAREIAALGHEVRLIPPAYVKPFVKRGKTDAADAEAIGEAVTRKTMRFVPVKTARQQAATMVLKTRALLVRQRTQAVNALRARFALMAVVDQIDAPSGQIDRLERSIVTEAKRDEDMRRLTTIPGVGAITAATIKSLVPDPGGFKSGRHFAAWLGLAPRPHSSGGKERLGRMSKMGNPELRTLLVIGATSVLRIARNDARARPWLTALLARRPFKVAAVALANKMARIIWALLNRGGIYRCPETLAITAVAV
jgi:transposase